MRHAGQPTSRKLLTSWVISTLSALSVLVFAPSPRLMSLIPSTFHTGTLWDAFLSRCEPASSSPLKCVAGVHVQTPASAAAVRASSASGDTPIDAFLKTAASLAAPIFQLPEDRAVSHWVQLAADGLTGMISTFMSSADSVMNQLPEILKQPLQQYSQVMQLNSQAGDSSSSSSSSSSSGGADISLQTILQGMSPLSLNSSSSSSS